MKFGEFIEIDELDEIPPTSKDTKFFICIGGKKNYQCFLESKKLSRGEFLDRYELQLDSAISILYQDEDVVVRQDVQFAIPGFYIIATKQQARRLKDLDKIVVGKCFNIANLIKRELLEDNRIQAVFIGYDEHYEKPTSTHFWVLPIHKEKGLPRDISIHDSKFWDYFANSYKFQETKEQINNYNVKFREILRGVEIIE